MTFEFVGEGPGGRPKWMIFTCPRDPERECTIAIKPQRNGVRASWEWDGNREAPTVSPSINCNGAAGCGWHGWIRKGVATSC